MVWKHNGGKVLKSEKMVSKWCALPVTIMLAMVMSLCLVAPAAAFLAYDCSNDTNVVEAYNLLEPAPCHVSGTDHRYERVVQAEIVQQKRERMIPVFRCHMVESVFSQYCGHSSGAGVTRYLKFREPLIVDPMECARAKDSNGNITINGKMFNARIGSQTSHSFFIARSLDRKHNCEVNTLVIGKQVINYQSAQSVLEISLTEEFGKVNDMSGRIKLSGSIYTKTSNRAAQDSFVGTMVWSHKETTCPQGLTPLYLGPVRIFSNESSSFMGGVALLEENGQVAGLELHSSNLLCHHPSYFMHLRDVAVIIHPNNFSSITTDAFDPSQVTDYIQMESELLFLHVKTTLSHRDRLRQVKLAICKTRCQVASTRLWTTPIASSKCLDAATSLQGRGQRSMLPGALLSVCCQGR
jgi:hypothetical protein